MSSSNRLYGFTWVRKAGQRPAVYGGELVRPPRVGQDLLHQQRVDVHQSGLEQV